MEQTIVRNGIPVGALICPTHHLGSIRSALADVELPIAREHWVKKNSTFELDDCDLSCLDLPINNENSKLLGLRFGCTGSDMLTSYVSNGEDRGYLPDILKKLLDDNEVTWNPGYRYYGDSLPWDNTLHHDPNQETLQTLEQDTLKYIELFAGIGGFRVGLDSLGCQCVFASEIDQAARMVYKQNFNDTPLKDITDICASSIPSHHLLTAGFPCQSFSKMGEQKGFDDSRGNLFFEITRILHFHKPLSFLLENVPHLRHHDSGQSLERILAALDDIGYNVQYKVIDSSVVLAQARTRIYFVGFRKDLKEQFENFKWPVYEDQNLTISSILENTDDMQQLSQRQWDKIRDNCEKHGESIKWRIADINGKARTLIGSYKTSFLKGSEFVPVGPIDSDIPPRFYTQKECIKLQGFPEDFDFSSNRNTNRFYRQIGNAVSPPIIAGIGKSILAALNSE
eukprot:TRINITY_DN12299_c0_g1_i1.p1 TRINITY_DN12299_c0_g1~~TRINITY_DN12299_c0_g1_i1.p1  ORF type:complete len:454 (-),score=87.81 TRINITY_DN12299_c0_g1_i1:68-1429(-)